MRELNTIQKRGNLNRVFAVDDKSNGNANHRYLVVTDNSLIQPKEMTLQFQKGARKSEDSIHGLLDTDLLEIVRDRIKGFQAGEFATREMHVL